jgi:hypothetical protein
MVPRDEAASLLSSTVQGCWRLSAVKLSGDQETHINAALARIEAAAPKDEIEAALAVQMACTHTAAMGILAKLDCGFGTGGES